MLFLVLLSPVLFCRLYFDCCSAAARGSNWILLCSALRTRERMREEQITRHASFALIIETNCECLPCFVVVFVVCFIFVFYRCTFAQKKCVCLKKISTIFQSLRRVCVLLFAFIVFYLVYIFFCVLCFIFCFLFFHNVFDSVCSCFSPERRLFVAFYFARFSVFLLLLLLLPLSLLLLLHRKRLESQIPAWQRFIYNQSRFRLVTQPAESRLRRRLRRRCRQRVNVSVSLSLSLSCCLWWCCCSTRRSVRSVVRRSLWCRGEFRVLCWVECNPPLSGYVCRRLCRACCTFR